MVLDTFMYLDYKEAREGTTLKEIVNDLSMHPDYGGGGIHYGEYAVLKEAVENEEVGSLKICCQSFNMGYDAGTAACTFTSDDENSVYVVYRGTGDGEWPDNGIGMTSATTVQQEKALAYFEEVVETMALSEENRVIVTGHSKGGNKSQFVAMETKYDEILDVCYSVDGQGFSEQAIHTWKDRYGEAGYEMRVQKLYGIHGENDYVNVLGNTIIPDEHIRYVKTPVEKTNFAGYHDIKYMFATLDYDKKTGNCITVFHGRKNSDTGQRGELAEYAAALSMGVMELAPDKRDGCAAVIMQLMESVNGEKSGINGEKLHLSDIKDFTVQGIPLIAGSLFQGKEGKHLVWSLFHREFLDTRPERNVTLQVNDQALLKQTAQLSEAAGHLLALTNEVRETANALPFYMKGYTAMYHRIKLSANEIERLSRKLQKVCSFQESVAGSYRKWDDGLCTTVSSDLAHMDKTVIHKV